MGGAGERATARVQRRDQQDQREQREPRDQRDPSEDSRDRREDRRDRSQRRAREDIIAAALRVAARKDLAQVRIEEIAEEAGYAPGSLYTYFKSKEELLAGAIGQMNEALLERLGAPLTDRPFDQALRQLLDRMYQVASEHRGLFFALLTAGPRRDDALSGEQVVARFHECRARFVGAFSRWMKMGLEHGALTPARSPEQHALVFMGIAHSFLVQWLFGGGGADLTAESEVVVAAFLEGARRRYEQGVEGDDR